MSNISKEKNEKRLPVIAPVIFVVETSNFISDSSSKTINSMMRNCVDNLKTLHNNDFLIKDYEIQIGILTGKEGWITDDKLVPVQDYSWKDISFGEFTKSNIIKELTEKITVEELFRPEDRFYDPAIIVLTDGYSSMWDGLFSTYIHYLWTNKLYRSSNRFVISVNELAKEEVFVNLVREGTYLEIIDDTEDTSKSLLTDLLLNAWTDRKVDIAEKYKGSVNEKKIVIKT